MNTLIEQLDCEKAQFVRKINKSNLSILYLA
jgi:hypothetical protein